MKEHNRVGRGGREVLKKRLNNVPGQKQNIRGEVLLKTKSIISTFNGGSTEMASKTPKKIAFKRQES